MDDPRFFVFTSYTLTPFHSFIDERSSFFNEHTQTWSVEKPKYKLLVGQCLPYIGETVFFIEQTSKEERCKENLYIQVAADAWENKAQTPQHRPTPYLNKTSYIDIRYLVPENVKELFEKYNKKPAEFAMVAKLPDNKKKELSNCFTNLPKYNLTPADQKKIKVLANVLPNGFIDSQVKKFIDHFYND